jgi:hypothetical protein
MQIAGGDLGRELPGADVLHGLLSQQAIAGLDSRLGYFSGGDSNLDLHFS